MEESISVPTEADIKKWIFEAIEACLGGKTKPATSDIDETLLSRQEAAKVLRISLGTLTDWTKRGLPHYRQRGRIYYTKRELVDYMKTNFPNKVKFSDKYVGFDKPN